MQPAGSSSGRHDRDERPRFRQDLIAELIDEQGGRFIDVMDPDSGNIFRFYEVEYSLACGMDGERDVQGIVKWAQDELGLSPSYQEVRTVIATLSDLGFIDTGAAADLAPGVLVGAQGRTPPPAQVELGSAGTTGPLRVQPLPPAPDFALGAAGATARHPAEQSIEDVALGTAGRRGARPTPAPGSDDVSLDLADHIPVGRAEVQEAVRASKVMAAVEVPQSVLDAIEDRPTAKAAPPQFDRPPEMLRSPGEARPEGRPEARPEARPDARPEARPEGRFEARPDARPEARVEAKPPGDVRVGKSPLTRQPSKPPVELPRQPHPATAPGASAPTAPAVPEGAPTTARVSPVLLVLLILVAAAAAVFLVWKYVLDKPDPAAQTSAEPPPAVQPVPAAPPPPPAPPPPVITKIVMETPAPDDVRATRNGVIETILADKATVKAGDVIAKFVGDKPIEAELANINRDLKRLQDQINASTARRDAAQANGKQPAAAAAQAEIDARQKALAIKQTQLDNKITELDKFLLHAPVPGTFTPQVKLGKKIAAHDVVATIQRDATPIATFKLAKAEDARAYTPNANVDLAVGTGEQRATCTIVGVQGDTIKVRCPVDPALTDGADVTLRPTAASPEAVPAPAPSGAPTAPPAEGSAAPAPGTPEAAPTAPAPAAPMPTTQPAAPSPPSPSPGP